MKRLLLAITLSLLATAALAQREVFTKADVAIQGYDPVSYFTDGKPVKGKPEFSYRYHDAVWHFSSANNLATFKSDPTRYAPQYGGYCAYGVADGHKASTSPDAWSIVDGKLYLNYNKEVQAMWKKDISGYINKAETNWPTVKTEKD